MALYQCKESDSRILAILNKQLLEDEKNDSKLSVDDLDRRMVAFLNGEYVAYFYQVDDETVGYALINMSETPKYLRQFFIAREFRRKGYGRAFFSALLAELGEKTMDLEVLARNEAGRKFWESLGFAPRSLYLRYEEE